MKRLSLLLIALLALPACIGRYKPDTYQHDCESQSYKALRAERLAKPLPKPRSAGASLQVVRLTDDGELHNRCEWSDALVELQADSAFPRGTVTVMFVHGWKHNAEPGDSDLERFTSLLDGLRERELRAGSDRRIVGLYLAWSGKRSKFKPYNQLTFWGRKKAADRIAQSAIVTKFIGAVDNIRRLRHNDNDRVVYAGHSFGARLLYNAIAQITIHGSQLAHPGDGGEFAPFTAAGDMVLLVNPAFEAQLFTALDGLNRKAPPFSVDQRPLIVSISAENDWATGKAFPVGQFFGRTWNTKRRITLGNYREYQTHHMYRRPAAQGIADAAAIAAHGNGAWFDHFCDASGNGVCLGHLGVSDKYPRNPFIIARASRSIVDGHGGIWKPEFVSFLADFIATAMQKPRPAKP